MKESGCDTSVVFLRLQNSLGLCRGSELWEREKQQEGAMTVSHLWDENRLKRSETWSLMALDNLTVALLSLIHSVCLLLLCITWYSTCTIPCTYFKKTILPWSAFLAPTSPSPPIIKLKHITTCVKTLHILAPAYITGLLMPCSTIRPLRSPTSFNYHRCGSKKR